MASRTFVYNDFSKGEYGRLGGFNPPKGSWTGSNMLVYRTGELGVRAGLRDVSPTGLANGVVWGMGRVPLNASKAWFGQGTSIRYFTVGGGGAVSTAGGAALTGAGSSSAISENGATTFLTTAGNNGYSFNGTTVTALASMPNAIAVALYGSRLIVVPTSAKNTIRYSDEADYTSWPVGNTITVGDTDAIGAILAQRAYLAILKGDSSFYALTGVPGVDDTLRAVVRASGPDGPGTAAAVFDDDRIWFVDYNGRSPSTFDGVRVDTYDKIVTPNLGILGLGITPLQIDDRKGFSIQQAANSGQGTAAKVWLYAHGVWSQHTFGVTTTQYAAHTLHSYPQNGSATLSEVQSGTCLVLTDGGGASAHPKFYSWQPFMDRPGLEADPFSVSAERAGDDSDASVSGNFTLPEQHSDSGTELWVRKVIIDFRSWKTGGSLTNHFDLAVTSLRQYSGNGGTASATQTWSEAASSSSLSGSDRRVVMNFGDQGQGGSFRLDFTNVRGVAIKEIVVVTDESAVR